MEKSREERRQEKKEAKAYDEKCRTLALYIAMKNGLSPSMAFSLASKMFMSRQPQKINDLKKEVKKYFKQNLKIKVKDYQKILSVGDLYYVYTDSSYSAIREVNIPGLNDYINRREGICLLVNTKKNESFLARTNKRQNKIMSTKPVRLEERVLT